MPLNNETKRKPKPVNYTLHMIHSDGAVEYTNCIFAKG